MQSRLEHNASRGLAGIVLLLLLLFVSDVSVAGKHRVQSFGVDGIKTIWEGDSLAECVEFLDTFIQTPAFLDPDLGMMRAFIDLPNIWSLSVRDLVAYYRYSQRTFGAVPTICTNSGHDVPIRFDERNHIGSDLLLWGIEHAAFYSQWPPGAWVHTQPRDSWMNVILEYLNMDVIARPLAYPGAFLGPVWPHRSSHHIEWGCWIWIQQCVNRVNRDLVPTLLEAMCQDASCSSPSSRYSLDWQLTPDGSIAPMNRVSLSYYLTVGRRGWGPYKWLRGWGSQPSTPVGGRGPGRGRGMTPEQAKVYEMLSLPKGSWPHPGSSPDSPPGPPPPPPPPPPALY